MVSAAKAFSKEPPRRPLTDLDAVVEDFQWRYVDRKKTDQVIRFCAEAVTFSEAVRRAVEARDAQGKHHNHQSKVDLKARQELGRKIAARRVHVMRLMKRAAINGFDQFDALHDMIDEIKPAGIGPVTVYDVAVRLGAFLGVYPTSVYLHAGVRQGYNALFGPGAARGIHSVPVSLLPPPLCGLAADDVEDILCTYREVFEGWGE